MKPLKQKNVYYIDLNKNIYRGYIETTFEFVENETEIKYKSQDLEIESIKIITGDKNKKNFNLFEVEFQYEKEESGFTFQIPPTIKSSFRVRIVFKPKEDNKSLLFYLPVNPKDKHKELVGHNSLVNSNSSCFAPYIDTYLDFLLYYVIPNTEEIKVVSSGVFKSIKEEDSFIIYYYTCNGYAKFFNFAVGTYEQIDVFSESDRRKIFLPVGYKPEDEELDDLKTDIQTMIKFVELFTKTEEVQTDNIVFSLINTMELVSKNMILIKYTYILKDIEMAFNIKKILAECISNQVYLLLNFKMIDYWIFYGLSGYLRDYILRYILGHNDYLFEYYNNLKYLIQNDTNEPSLFYTLRNEMEYHSLFFRTKSKMVFHCMKRELSYAFIQKISDTVIRHCLKTEEEEVDSIFTNKFIKIVKDATGTDLKTFFDFYVFKPGLLKVKMTLNINRKKNTVKVGILQTPTSTLPGSNKQPLNSYEIKSYETEGVFEHIIDPNEENSFIYHTRTKKKKDQEEGMSLLYVRADTSQKTLYLYEVIQPDYMSVEQLQDKSVIGQMEAISSLGNKPTLSSCEALEKVLENNHVFYKIRIEVMKILSNIHLNSDGNTTDNTGDFISGMNNNGNFMLMNMAEEFKGPSSDDVSYDGLQRLIQYFVRTKCVPNSTILKGNEFNLIPYFIQKHLVRNIGNVRHRSKVVFAFLNNILKYNDNSMSGYDDSYYISTVINLYSIHALIQYNKKTVMEVGLKNSMNSGLGIFDTVTGNSYESLHTSINTTGTTKSSILNIQDVIDQIERFRLSDMVFPSNNNVVSSSCLISLIRLAYFGKVSLEEDVLLSISKYPNLYSIRFVAIEGIFILFPNMIPEIFNIINNDTPFIISGVLNIIIRLLSVEKTLTSISNESKCFSYISSFFKDTPLKYNNMQLDTLITQIKCILFDKPFPSLYDFTTEMDNRNRLLKSISTRKTIKIMDFDGLIMARFRYDYRLVIPRTITFKVKSTKPKITKRPLIVPKLEIESSKSIRRFNSLEIRLPSTICFVKTDDLLIKMRRLLYFRDIPSSNMDKILSTKYYNSVNVSIVDGYVSKMRVNNDFFSFEPKTSLEIFKIYAKNSSERRGRNENKEIEESKNDVSVLDTKATHADMTNMNATYVDSTIMNATHVDTTNMNAINADTTTADTVKANTNVDIATCLSPAFFDIENALIFVLSYSQSKIYNAAKTLFNLLEDTTLSVLPFKPHVLEMDSFLRQRCAVFLTSLMNNFEYNAFKYPVDHHVLRNYLDVVRVTVCLQNVYDSLIDEDLKIKSWDLFVSLMRRIPRNCLNYNHCQSQIALLAKKLSNDIEDFFKEINQNVELLIKKSTFTIISQIIKDSKINEYLPEFNLNSFNKIQFWGCLNDKLLNYSKNAKTSSNSKMINNSLEYINKELFAWFGFDGTRVITG